MNGKFYRRFAWLLEWSSVESYVRQDMRYRKPG